MSLYWLFFASLSVIGSLGYNVGMKLAGPNTNPFGFVFVMTSVILFSQAICCVIAKYFFHANVTQGIDAHAMKFAAVSGLSAALIDVSYTLALRHGSVISSQVFWTIGGMIAVAVFAAFFVGETITVTKAVGILMGIAAVVLITK